VISGCVVFLRRITQIVRAVSGRRPPFRAQSVTFLSRPRSCFVCRCFLVDEGAEPLDQSINCGRNSPQRTINHRVVTDWEQSPYIRLQADAFLAQRIGNTNLKSYTLVDDGRVGNFSLARRDYSIAMTEAQLLRRAREGDEDAFSQLFARHERAVFRYAAYMCGREGGDDIVQETFLAVLQQSNRDDAPTGTVRAYLMGIARHRVLKRLASRGARIDAESIDDEAVPEVDAADLTALDLLVDAERVAAVRTAVQALPPVFREALVLCDLQELPYADAAAVLECPVGTVRSRLSRGRSLLAAALSAYRPGTRARGTTA